MKDRYDNSGNDKPSALARCSAGTELADANRKDAEEFCKGAFGPFVADVSQYVDIVAELLDHATVRAVAQVASKPHPLGPATGAFHRALQKYPEGFAALHYFWNEVFAGQPQEPLDTAQAAPETYTEVCLNEKCPRGGTPVEIVGSATKAMRDRNLAPQPVDPAYTAPEGFVLVPKIAVEWLHGEGTDADGKWFGEGEPLSSSTRHKPYWWRSTFRRMCSIPSTHQPYDLNADVEAASEKVAEWSGSTQEKSP